MSDNVKMNNRIYIFMNEVTGEIIYQNNIKKPDDCVYITHLYEQRDKIKEEQLSEFIKDRIDRNMLRKNLLKLKEFHPEFFI